MPSAQLEYVPRASDVPRGPFVSRVIVPGRRVAQRVLLLGATGTEPAYLEAQAALDRIGAPYRALIASTEPLTATILGDAVAACNFSGVIVATSGLGYNGPGGVWQSALTTAQWLLLDDFERACNARELTWYGYPSADFGLSAGAAFDSTVAVDGRLTAAGAATLSRVKASALVPYRTVYGYRGAIADPATTTSLIEAVDGGVLLAQRTLADGRELMISTVDSNPYLTHALLLEYDMIRWVNRGLFVGKKRAYLTPQIDDLFIADTIWIVGVGDPETTEMRITGVDYAAFIGWQSARQASLPAGSSFKTALAYNGVGTSLAEYPDPTLLSSVRANGARVNLINHTWDHENLDALTRAATLSEVQRNLRLGPTLALPYVMNAAELVTPDMSGLTNSQAVLGMLDAGVRYVVSDTSHTAALFPANPGDNPAFNVGRYNAIDARLYQIPRHPTSIFYDTGTPATQTDEYNFLYRSYYGRDLAYAEVLDKDSAFGLFYLLQGDIDPLMFHQTNLTKFTSGGANHTLYGDWVDAVVAKYLALTAAPVITLKESELGGAMQARGALNACGVTATKIEAATSATLELKSTGSCVVPITGLASPSAGSVETYAGAPTTSIPMTANGVKTIALP